MSKYTVPSMIKNGGGKIINLASLNSSIAVPNIIAYTSAKSGIAGLTRSMAVEWSRYNIRVNAIAPGFCRTALTEKLFQDKKNPPACLIIYRLPHWLMRPGQQIPALCSFSTPLFNYI